jgi:hypothetical protein
VRRAAAAALALALAGCGAPSADLFEVRRSGPDPKANLTMVVSDGGSVTCNGHSHDLGAERLLEARELARSLNEQAELQIHLAPGPGTDLSYRVRLEAGSVSFSDRSRGMPQAFYRLAFFTKRVAEDVCGIDRDSVAPASASRNGSAGDR